MKHIHILGICGTFMGALAVIARELGYRVTGSDDNIYPPMSTYLASQGIEMIQGFDPAQLHPVPDCIVVGNTMKRGMPIIEALLNQHLPMMSGPAFLEEHVLQDKWVLVVTGTHGKTTTTSMLAWILEYAGLQPGFLIGGIPPNFGVSSRLGKSDFFVIEGDEYDTAFFDKRSKFIHYAPRTLIMNNLELDHVDIFENLAAIQKQFHHLLRIVPSEGCIIAPAGNPNIEAVFDQGVWTPRVYFGGEGTYTYHRLAEDGHRFEVLYQGQSCGVVGWDMIGDFNIENALAAIAAAKQVGVVESIACEALCRFQRPKRRLEQRGQVNQITVYDDFAHHPTAIAKTISALRAKVKDARILAVFEPRSNSMKRGEFQASLAGAMQGADTIFLYEPPQLTWSVAQAFSGSKQPYHLSNDIEVLVQKIFQEAQPGDHILIMSNGGFGGIHDQLLNGLANACNR